MIKLSLLILFFLNFPQLVKAEIGSVSTDITTDCGVDISRYKLSAPTDFLKVECKALGGYRLFHGGGSGSYGPILTFEGKLIDLHRPFGLHSLGSNQIDWIYEVIQDQYGLGTITYKALIFKLLFFVGNPDDRQESLFHVVRLNKKESCIIGKTSTKKEALSLATNDSAKCLTKN